MILTPLIEFQNLEPMNIPKYFKTTKVAELLSETIVKGRTNKETAELLNVSSSTINRYKKAIGITSNRNPVTRTTEEKQAAMLKSMKTKARNKLIKEEMEKIKSLPSDQQLSKIEKFKTKYNISSERLNIQAGSKSTKGKNKKKKNITELNEQQGKGKIEGSLEPQPSIKPYRALSVERNMLEEEKVNNPIIYSGDTKDISLLLSKNPNPAIKELLQQKAMEKYGLGKENATEPFVVNDETVARYSNI